MAQFQSNFEKNCCEYEANEVKEQSVDEKTGGAEPAVSHRIVLVHSESIL